MHECQKAIHRLVSSPSYWFDAFKSRGSVKFGIEKLEKKEISYRHSSTGYHVVARQKLYFLFLRAVCILEREREKKREREMSHVSLLTGGWLCIFKYHTTCACTHTYTHICAKPKPKIPWCVMTGCNCQHALLQLLILTHYTSLSPQSVYLALSLFFPLHLHPLPFSLLFPFHFFLSMGFFFFFSSSTVWMTSLMSSILSRPFSLKASSVVI